MECHRIKSRPQEDRCSEKDGTSTGCGNNEKFPRPCQLSQQVQSMFSRVKQPS